MSTVIEEFVARLGWEVDSTQLGRFERQLTGLKDSLRRTFFVATAGAVAVTAGLNKVMGAFSLFEDAEAAFTPLMGGAEKARDMVQALADTAATTPFQFENLAGAAKLLLPSMNQDIEKTIETTRMLGDTAGGNAQRMESIIRGYNKALMKGRVDLEGLNILMEGGSIPIIQEMSASLGVTKEQLYKMITAGKVSADDLTATFKKMTSEGGIYYKGMEIASKTLTGRISTLKDNVIQAASKLGEAFAPAVKRVVDRLIDYIPVLQKWFVENRKLIEQGFTEFVSDLADALKMAVSMGKGIHSLIRAVGGLGNALKIAGAAFVALRIVPIAETLNAMVINAKKLGPAMSSAGKMSLASWGKMAAVMGGLYLIYEDIIYGLQGKKSITGALSKSFEGMLLSLEDRLTGYDEGVKEIFRAQITTTFDYAWTTFKTYAENFLPTLGDIFAGVWNNSIGWVLNQIWYAFDALVRGAKKLLGFKDEKSQYDTNNVLSFAGVGSKAPKPGGTHALGADWKRGTFKAPLALPERKPISAIDLLRMQTPKYSNSDIAGSTKVPPVNVNIYARTNASPDEIAKLAGREIDKRMNRTARNMVDE